MCTSIVSYRLWKRYSSQGEDLIESINSTASSRTFINETGVVVF